MNLAQLQAEIQAHLDRRPAQPCPVSEMTPKQYAVWSRDLAAWAETKEMLQGLVDSFGFHMEFRRQAPQCSPRSDYHYREPLGRKRKPSPRPAWSGATPEYNAQKARESRAKKKAERMERTRQAVREVIKERDAA